MRQELTRVVDQLRDNLHGTDDAERAEVLEHLARTIYDHVKFRAPEGGGFDGRDGPERAGLGRVIDVVITHRTNGVRRPAGLDR